MDYLDGLKVDDIPSCVNGGKRDLNIEEYTLYSSLVGQIKWLSNGTRPEVSFDTIELSTKFAHATTENLVAAVKTVKRLKISCGNLVFPKLTNLHDMKMVVFADANLTNLDNSLSCGGHLIFLMDSQGKCALLAWHCRKIKRVCRSTMATETIAMANALEEALYLREISKICVNVAVPILSITDNRSMLQAVQSTSLVLEKRLRIEMSAIKEMVAANNVSLTWATVDSNWLMS